MSEMVRSVTAAEFDREVLQAEGLMLVDFWAAWCPPCRRLAPTIDALATEYEGRLAVTKVDIDENPELAQRYGIQSIPTLILFKNGEPIARQVGAVPKNRLADWIKGAM